MGSADCESRSAHFPRREPKEPRANAGLFFSSCRWCRATSHRIGRSRSRSMRSAHQQCRSDCPSLSNVSACGSCRPCCCDEYLHATYDAACDARWYRQRPVPGRLCLRLRKLLPARSYQFSLLSYLLVPEPGPVGVTVEPLGEEFGPSVLPDGLMVLFGLAPAPPVVVPSMELPVVVELPAVPPAVELPPAEPAAEPPPAAPPPAPPAPPPPPCANAKVEPRARTDARAIVVVFMVALSWVRAGPTTAFQRRSKKIKY